MTGRHAARRGYIRNPWTAVILHTLIGSVLIVALWIYNPAPPVGFTPRTAPRLTTTAAITPQGVPASYAGPLRANYTGRQLYNTWLHNPGAGGDCSPATGPVTFRPGYGWVDLHTNGKVANCAEIVSPTMWTAGVFEARVWFPGTTAGRFADFAAYWMSGYAGAWPRNGEIDALEAMGGWGTATWHYNYGGPNAAYHPAELHHELITTRPGWYTVDIVRKPSGVIEVWYNHRLVWSFATRYPVLPEKIIFDITDYAPGRAAELYVASVRIWNYR